MINLILKIIAWLGMTILMLVLLGTLGLACINKFIAGSYFISVIWFVVFVVVLAGYLKLLYGGDDDGKYED